MDGDVEEGDRDGLGRGSFGGGTILDVGVGIKGVKDWYWS